MKRIAAALAVASVIGAGSTLALAENYGTHDSGKNTNTGSNSATDMRHGGSAGADATDGDKGPAAYPADNSGRNQRDANGNTPTAEDQSNNKQDIEITQNIRRAVTADDSLSMNGKNVKIITNAGVVTLRGPVKDEAEKAKIAAAAKGVTGVTRVDNQLEIAR